MSARKVLFLVRRVSTKLKLDILDLSETWAKYMSSCIFGNVGGVSGAAKVRERERVGLIFIKQLLLLFSGRGDE